MDMLRDAVLMKVAFWLVVIGLFALLTPQPAWPEWLARMVLSTGIALVVTVFVVRWRNGRRGGGGKGGSAG